MKLYITFISVFLFSTFIGCNTESRDNSRAYVEGKITGTNLDFSKISVIIKNENTNVATTNPNNSGDFVLSGPLLSATFSLVLNKKIKSFSASKNGCKLSADQLQIQIPAGTTYVTFNEIVLE